MTKTDLILQVLSKEKETSLFLTEIADKTGIHKRYLSETLLTGTRLGLFFRYKENTRFKYWANPDPPVITRKPYQPPKLPKHHETIKCRRARRTMPKIWCSPNDQNDKCLKCEHFPQG